MLGQGSGRNSPVDLTNPAGVRPTNGCMYSYGLSFAVPLAAYHDHYDLSYRILAPYGSLNYQIGKLASGAITASGQINTHVMNGHTVTGSDQPDRRQVS